MGNVLTIAQPMVINATLAIGPTTEKVTVTAGAQLVQTENSGDLGALVDKRALETRPVVGARGRSPIDLLEGAIPGVVDGGPLNSEGANIEGGGVYVNGSRDRSWNYTLDADKGTLVRIRHGGFVEHPEIAQAYRGWPRMLGGCNPCWREVRPWSSGNQHRGTNNPVR